ncbi:MAG: GvpL/GvpF family gas vesicle protein [Stigonema ocellatum SAG 48.90 = DSM 106950]|nr:GvpL/GvpF family gas vesicle protein [Stigonema ocellatum SAG 48.90 = DSM 106950]
MESQNIYTYAFLKHPEIPLYLPKGAASQVLLIDGTELSAIVELGISLESFQTNDEQLINMALAHDRVICEIFHQITVLPLRFGTYFHSQTSLLNHIESHTREYQEKLEQINGKNEYTLKLIPRKLEEAVQPSDAVRKGKDYFLAKKQHYENQTIFSVAQANEKYSLIDLITQIYEFSAMVQHQDEEVRIYLLVSLQDKPFLLEQFLNWQKACPRWNLSLQGGFPPYHFI